MNKSYIIMSPSLLPQGKDNYFYSGGQRQWNKEGLKLIEPYGFSENIQQAKKFDSLEEAEDWIAFIVEIYSTSYMYIIIPIYQKSKI